ncbi:zf-HC2 domain-containing protein [Paenibacillus turpanensis]|uniref:zf-HC2 domain-containing protein n=1 Tax=Paenibacillus turpanensis TaxID=2689078 RepID=UPI0014093744|nr:zf-HC2 domain-containing protein [Paenibacillus turpanensis]
MNCKEAIPYIHDYLDGDLNSDGRMKLRLHLDQCESCRSHLNRLEQTDAMLFRMASNEPSTTLSTEQIMSAIPMKRKAAPPSWLKWVRNHPAASVAAVFLVVMFTSITSLWNQGSQLTVSGKELEKLVFSGSTVTVPAGEVIKGDIVVENGTVHVDGQLDGNLVVIDGSVAMASTAQVTGNVKSVNMAIDWLWYKVGSWFQFQDPERK